MHVLTEVLDLREDTREKIFLGHHPYHEVLPHLAEQPQLGDPEYAQRLYSGLFSQVCQVYESVVHRPECQLHSPGRMVLVNVFHERCVAQLLFFSCEPETGERVLHSSPVDLANEISDEPTLRRLVEEREQRDLLLACAVVFVYVLDVRSVLGQPQGSFSEKHQCHPLSE